MLDQTHVVKHMLQIKHSLAHIQDLIPALAGIRYGKQKHLRCM